MIDKMVREGRIDNLKQKALSLKQVIGYTRIDATNSRKKRL